MSFKTCIQTAVDAGKISAKKAQEGFDAFDEAVENAKAQGLEPDKAEFFAAQKATEEITQLKGAKRWQRINEMRKTHEIYTRLSKSMNPVEDLPQIMKEVEIAHLRVTGQALANLDSIIMKYKPKAGGFIHPVDNMDEVVLAAHGDVRNVEAGQMAEAIQQTDEWLRQRGNMEGASVRENVKRKLPQTQDRIKVKAAKVTKAANGSVIPTEWLNDHLEHLDFDLVEYAGKTISEADRNEVLTKIYNRILTNGESDLKPGQNTGMNMANRMARERFFYYKDGQSWLYMQKKYGAGNIIQQAYGHIDATARNIALMEKFGPNPNTMKEFAKRTAANRAAELQVQNPASSWTTDMAAANDLFEEMWKIYNFQVLNGEESLAVQTISALRTYTTGTKLGGVFLSALPGDIATSKWAAQFHKLPQTGHIREYFKEFIGGKRTAQQAIRDGVIYQSGVNLMLSHARYFGIMDGPHWVRRFSDIVYRTGLATHHTATARHMNAQHLQGAWADDIGKKFDELSYSTSLTRAGITEKDWDIFRQTPLTNRDGATFLRPMDLYSSKKTSDKRVADKFLDFMQMYIRDAVPEPDIRVQATMGTGVTARSVRGQIVRSATQLASFPATLMLNHWKKIWTAPTPKDKMWLATTFFIEMTVAGAFITQAKAIAQGQNPHNMDPTENPEFWGRAMLNGGSMGLLGDFIFNNVSVANSQYFNGDTPMGQWASSMKKLTLDNVVDAVKGKKDLNMDKDAVVALNASIPKLWFMRLLLDRSIMDELLKDADPAAWRSKERFAKQHEEGRWWKPGQDPNLPDFSHVLGDE